MKKILFAALILITSATTTAQTWRVQNQSADGISLNFMTVGVDPNNLPEKNFFAVISNDNDFEVHATLTLFTEARDLAVSYDIVIPANAYETLYPIGLIYWTQDWERLAGTRGARIDLDIHEKGLTKKLWAWVYLPRHAWKGK